MHYCHLTGSTLGTFIVAGEVLLDVAVLAVHPESMAVAPIHNQQQPCGGNALEYLDVLEHLLGRLLFVSCNLLSELLNKAIIDLLVYRLCSCCWRRRLSSGRLGRLRCGGLDWCITLNAIRSTDDKNH